MWPSALAPAAPSRRLRPPGVGSLSAHASSLALSCWPFPGCITVCSVDLLLPPSRGRFLTTLCTTSGLGPTRLRAPWVRWPTPSEGVSSRRPSSAASPLPRAAGESAAGPAPPSRLLTTPGVGSRCSVTFPLPLLLGPAPSLCCGVLCGESNSRHSSGLPPLTAWGISWEVVPSSRPCRLPLVPIVPSHGAAAPWGGPEAASPRVL
jgi:hypothetical protein